MIATLTEDGRSLSQAVTAIPNICIDVTTIVGSLALLAAVSGPLFAVTIAGTLLGVVSGSRSVARGAILWHMSAQREVSQRDLRMRSKEIMDAVERGDSFTVTRDGHQIGELVPLRRRRRFVSRAQFARGSQLAPLIDVSAFRADQDSAYDQALSDPYAR